MKTEEIQINQLADKKYKYGFTTNLEQESIPPGLNVDVIKFISQKKNEPSWMLDWRLKAYEHWCGMNEPKWANISYPKIDYNSIIYYSAPKSNKDGPKSLDEVDPKLIETYNKLGIPLEEQKALAGVAVDAVFDSVSVVTTFKKSLEKAGVIFCPISEAIEKYPELIKKY